MTSMNDHSQDITRDDVVRRIDRMHSVDFNNPTLRLALVYVLAFADAQGLIEVSPGELAQFLRRAPRTAQRSLKELVDSGFIRHLGIAHDDLGRFGRSRYQLVEEDL